MKAVAVFPKTREIKVIDYEEPHITEPTHVKLRMLDVGVCGTDKEICSFQYGTPPAGSDYLIIGHESLGEVSEVGSAVSHVKPGDLVVTTVRRPCASPACLPCRSGFPDFCRTGDYTERGIKGEHGFMAEFVVDHENNMHVVPPELRNVAVLVEPLTIAEKAKEQVLQIIRRLPWVHPDTTRNMLNRQLKAVVLGAGPVGLLGALGLATAGWETYVYALPPAPNPASTIIDAIGAKYVSKGQLSPEKYEEFLGNIDLVYEATGVSSLAFEALKLLGPNSVFIFTGVPGRKAPIEVDTDRLMHNVVLKNLILLGTVNADARAFDGAIHDLGTFNTRWPDALRALITSRTPIEDAQDVLLGKTGGIKNVISLEQAHVLSPIR
ncbi:MAG TPA: glucose 1-dehydrogenase [Ktedonobacteraceae bacterium]|jgi:threonine dehydrogenase-like Zn-dependent dehydrogenase